MDYFIITSQVGIFVFKNIIAMRADGEDLLHLIHFENFNILKRLHLV